MDDAILPTVKGDRWKNGFRGSPKAEAPGNKIAHQFFVKREHTPIVHGFAMKMCVANEESNVSPPFFETGARAKGVNFNL
jgi:hypothetical protein